MTDTEGSDEPVTPEPEHRLLDTGSAGSGASVQKSEPAAEGADHALIAAPARRSRGWIVAAAALLVVATFLGVLAARYKAELDRERNELAEVQAVAARFSEAFFTYDYRTLEAGLQRITRDATPKYAREFKQLYNTSISTLLTATKARSVGTVTDVFVGPVDDETASVMTVATVAREGIAGRLPLAGQYLQLDLVKRGGTWRVDNVLSVDLTQPNRSGSSGTTTTGPTAATTTSVPK
jgi:Mce-associated membrane protein